MSQYGGLSTKVAIVELKLWKCAHGYVTEQSDLLVVVVTKNNQNNHAFDTAFPGHLLPIIIAYGIAIDQGLMVAQVSF